MANFQPFAMLFLFADKLNRKGGRTFTGGTERRLAIIKHICRVRKTTMQEMSEKFGVSVRTIRRDVDELSVEMGIPIYTQAGKYGGGVYVDKDYTMDRMYMTENELELLTKVQKMVTDRLSPKESAMFDYIIKAHKKPQKKFC